MKKTLPVVLVSALAISISAHTVNAASGPLASISPLLGTPEPTKMACTRAFNANDDYVTTAVNTSVIISPLANDQDNEQQNFGGILSNPQHGTVQQVSLDHVMYTPNANFVGTDSFTYLHEGCLQCSSWGCTEPSDDIATVYITVTN